MERQKAERQTDREEGYRGNRQRDRVKWRETDRQRSRERNRKAEGKDTEMKRGER